MLLTCKQSNYHGKFNNNKYIPSTLMIVSAIFETGDWDFSQFAENQWLFFLIVLSILPANKVTQ